MGKRSQRSRHGANQHMRASRGFVTIRKDGTVYSQDRVVTDLGSDKEHQVPSQRARDIIGKLGLSKRKFRGTDGIDRPIS